MIETLGRAGIAAAALEDNRRLVAANAAMRGLLGLDADAFVGTDIGNVLANQAKDAATVGLSAVYRFDTAGQSPWYRLDLKQVDAVLIGILVDIGSAYEPHEEVRVYHQTRDRLLLDGKIGTWHFDPDAELYYFSSELNLGHPGAGSPVPIALLQMLQHPDDKDRDSEIRDRITREGGAANAEMRYLGADGAWTHLNVHYRAGRRRASGRYEMFGISQDITAVARARDEANQLSHRLSEALRQADYANRTKTEFLANMSHELRTPLNAILGFSEMIARQTFGPAAGKYVEYARDIHRSGEHLLDLVNDVLDLAKLEAGKLELRESEIFVPELVDDCLTLVRGRADAAKLRLSHHIAPAASMVRADTRAIRQVLLNFLSNAVKFTPAGGAIAVSTAIDGAGRLLLAVRDSGIGMKRSDIATALAPFGQIDSRLARKHKGTGLGLPICKSLMELHGGDITIDSEPGLGTTMTARFPPERTLHESKAAAS
jgi:signal transduction histidine kinase